MALRIAASSSSAWLLKRPSQKRPLTHEGQPTRFLIRAKFADTAHRLLDRLVGNLGHGEILLPVREESDPGEQRAFRQAQAIGLEQLLAQRPCLL